MTTTLTVRLAESDDLSDIRGLLTACDLPPEGVEACLSDCLLVGERGALRACAATERCEDGILLRSLAVTADARGEGVAAVLVDALLDRARASGAHSAWLLTNTAADWFAVRGWSDMAREQAPVAISNHAQFLHLCPASARLMYRAL